MLHKNIVSDAGGARRSLPVPSISIPPASTTIVPILRTNIIRESRLMTDKAPIYKNVGKEFAEHATVDHSIDEYVRGDIHSNTVEGYYSIFKRGMKGVYQHCAEKHLHRYLASSISATTTALLAALAMQRPRARRDRGEGHRRQAPDLSTGLTEPENIVGKQAVRFMRWRRTRKRNV